MFRKTDAFLIIGFILVFFAILYFGVVWGSDPKIDCNVIVYGVTPLGGQNWTLGLLRNLTAYCSNGG